MYMVINGDPGWSKEAFNVIEERAEKNLVIINLVIDEMYLKQKVEMDNQRKIYGYINKGVNGEFDSDAKNALVFLVNALN